MNVFVIGVTYHEFRPGNDYISLNKETTVQIQSMHKEYTHHSEYSAIKACVPSRVFGVAQIIGLCDKSTR